jgi:hypothetical protein
MLADFLLSRNIRPRNINGYRCHVQTRGLSVGIGFCERCWGDEFSQLIEDGEIKKAGVNPTFF